MPLQPGTLLHNRYRILEVIAKGGMGAIYKAHDESLAVDVAVKENLYSTEEHIKQFHREATILASLRHPNLPRVTDHFVIENQGQYLVMDYIPGEDLKDRIKRSGALNEEETTLIGAAICDALGYLHRRNPPIVHRDVKPGNVKITPTGQIYLVDFGLAKIIETGQATSTGAQALTPGYAPPEQYGQGTEPRSDLYALAATLYAAITGAMPEDALGRAMGSLTLTPIRQRAPRVSDRLAGVIEKCMSIAPDDRYPTAEDFKKALLNANTTARRQVNETGEAIIPPPPTGSTPAAYEPTVRAGTHPSKAKPNRKGFSTGTLIGIIGGAVLLVLLLIGGAAALGLPRLLASQNSTSTPSLAPTETPAPTKTLPQPTPTPTDIPVAASQNTPEPSATAQPSLPSPTPTIHPTPTGGGAGLIAFTSERTGLPQIWLMNTDGTAPRQVTNLPDGACQADFSPNGEWIVFITPCRKRATEYQNSNLAMIRTDGSSQRFLDTLPGGDFDPAWSPDGKTIAFTSLRDGRKQIFLYDLASNTVTKLSTRVSLDYQPSWSPDGTRLAFITFRNAAAPDQVWLMDINGQNAREFSQAGSASTPSWSPDGSILIFSQGSPAYLIARQVRAAATEVRISTEYRGITDARYSPDGLWFVFTHINLSRLTIVRMNRNGGEFTPLTDGSTADYDPVWSPSPSS